MWWWHRMCRSRPKPLDNCHNPFPNSYDDACRMEEPPGQLRQRWSGRSTATQNSNQSTAWMESTVQKLRSELPMILLAYRPAPPCYRLTFLNLLAEIWRDGAFRTHIWSMWGVGELAWYMHPVTAIICLKRNRFGVILLAHFVSARPTRIRWL